MSCRHSITLALALGTLAVSTPRPAGAEERVPLTENFSAFELTTVTLSITVGPAVLLGGPRLVDAGVAEIMTPTGSLDYAISSTVHGDLDTGARMAFGLSDPLLLYLPWVGALYFGASAAWLGAFRRPLVPGQSPNIDHLAFTYFEAVGWTAVAVGAGRLLVRRDRPWVALDRPQFARDGIEPTTSTASSHTALGAAAASVLSRSLWVELKDQPFAIRLLPQVALWGFVGFASFAHVHDQENFFTDELLGLAVGTTLGQLAYSIHFDADGRPRGNPE